MHEIQLPARYKVRASLGSGGMGAVYRVTDGETGQEVALKILSAQRPGRLAKARLRREFHAISRLNHRNVVKVLAADTEWDPPYYTMEVLDGGSLLSNHLASRQPPPADEIRRRVKDIADITGALSSVHKIGVIHRDIKPSNILYDEKGVPKLTDFGLAAQQDADSTLTQTGALVGSLPYMSPEQALGKRVDHRTDLYALGVVLYELVAGSRPFDGRDTLELIRLQATHIPLPPSRKNPAVSGFLANIIMKLLKKDPADRYLTADDLEKDLGSHLDGSGEALSAEAAPRLTRPPFLGRQEEMAALSRVLDRAVAGDGGVVLVSGEAGVGKTTLIEELRSRAVLSGVAYLKGRSVKREGVYYGPFADVIRVYNRRVGMYAKEWEEEVFGGIGKVLARLVPELEERSFIRELPELPALEEKDDKNRLFDSVTVFIQKITETEPLLVLLDDLQWADELTLELLVYVARNVHSCPILLAGTYRSEEVIDREGRRHPIHDCVQALKREEVLKESIVLQRFDRALTEDLVRAMCPAASPEPALLRFIYDKSSGNPFFVEELVAALDRAGALGAAGAVSGEAQGVVLPETITDVIRGRLERCEGEGLRKVLRAVAVFGKAIPFDVLRALVGLQEDVLLDHLDQLVHHGIIEEGEGHGGDSYSLAHPLMADLTYEGMNPRRRKLLHKRTAELLEEIAGSDAPDARGGSWARELVYHWERAENVERTLLHCREAGMEAAAALANADAVRYLCKVVDNRERLGLSADQLVPVLDTLTICARRFMEPSGCDSYLNLYVQTALEAGDADRHLDAALRAAGGLEAQGRIGEATEAFESLCRTYSEGHLGKTAERHHASHLLRILGKPDEALRLLEPLSRTSTGELQVYCMLDLMGGLMRTARFGEAQGVRRQLAEIIERQGNLVQRSRFLEASGILSGELGSMEEARSCFEKQIATDVRTGNVLDRSTASLRLAEIHHERGDWRLAMEQYNEVLALYERLGRSRKLVEVKEHLAWLHLEMGSIAKARDLTEEVHRSIVTDAIEAQPLLARNALRRASLARVEGRPDAALGILQKARGQVEDTGQLGYLSLVAVPEAELLMEGGKIADARSLLASCRAVERYSGRPRWLAEAEARLLECDIREGAGEAAEMVSRAEIVAGLGHRYRSAIIWKRLARALLDGGRNQEAQEALDRAHQAFTEMEAGQDLAEVGAWLGATRTLELSGAAPKQPVSTVSMLDLIEGLPRRLAVPPLVGRDGEIATLLDEIRGRLRDRRGMLYLIEGETGVGKTRLTFELMKRLETVKPRPRTAVGLCQQERQGHLFAPLFPVVMDLLPHIERAARKALKPVLLELYPTLGSRIEFEGVKPAPELSPAGHKNRAMDTLFRFLRGVAGQEGLVLFLDDLGYADQATLDTLQYLARNITQEPLVIFGNFNSREVGAAHRLREVMAFLSRTKERVHRVLEPLTDVDIFTLLQEVLDKDADVGDLAGFLSERTGGNALYLRELLCHLARHELIEKTPEGAYQLRTWSVPTPASVAELVRGGIAGLHPHLLQILESAAVLGREFDFDILAGVLELDEEELLGGMEALEEARLLTPLEHDPLGRSLYRFTVPQLQGLLYEDLDSASRTRLHRKTGEVLEQKREADRAQLLGELAYHFGHGDEEEKTLAYTLQAGKAAQERFSLEEAKRLFLGAVERMSAEHESYLKVQCALAEIARDTGDVPECRRRVDSMTGRAAGSPLMRYHRLKVGLLNRDEGPEAAVSYLRKLPASSWTPGVRLKYFETLAGWLNSASRYQDAIAVCEQGLVLEKAHPDPHRAVELRRSWAWALSMSGQHESALALLQKDLERLDELPHRLQVAVLKGVAHAHSKAPRPEEAIRYQLQVCERLEKAQDVTSLAPEESNLALDCAASGDLKSAKAHAEAALEISSRLDLTTREFTAVLVLAYRFYTEECAADREQLGLELQRLYAQSTSPTVKSNAYTGEFDMAVATGDWAWMLDHGRSLLEDLRDRGWLHNWKESGVLVVWSLLAAGRSDEAGELRGELEAADIQGVPGADASLLWSRFYSNPSAAEGPRGSPVPPLEEIIPAIEKEAAKSVGDASIALLLGRSLLDTPDRPEALRILRFVRESLCKMGVVAFDDVLGSLIP